MEYEVYILAVFALLCAIPVGYLLKSITKEELKSGKKYFKIIWAVSLILVLASIFLPVSLILKQTIIFSLLFIAIVSFISWK